MQVLDIKELVRNSKDVTEEGVREAVETIRRVEQLGGRRSQYNLASPFSPLGSARDISAPKALKSKTRR